MLLCIFDDGATEEIFFQLFLFRARLVVQESAVALTCVDTHWDDRNRILLLLIGLR